MNDTKKQPLSITERAYLKLLLEEAEDDRDSLLAELVDASWSEQVDIEAAIRNVDEFIADAQHALLTDEYPEWLDDHMQWSEAE